MQKEHRYTKRSHVSNLNIRPELFRPYFFINNGKAKDKDIVDLIKLAKKTVFEKFDINLELEIKTLGFSPGTFDI